MIGLSLSFCVQSCLEGKANPASVTKVYTSTRARHGDWSEVLRSYRENYWRKDPDRGEAIFKDWLSRGLIVQPLLENRPAPNINETGVWVTEECHIKWRSIVGGKDIAVGSTYTCPDCCREYTDVQRGEVVYPCPSDDCPQHEGNQ